LHPSLLDPNPPVGNAPAVADSWITTEVKIFWILPVNTFFAIAAAFIIITTVPVLPTLTGTDLVNALVGFIGILLVILALLVDSFVLLWGMRLRNVRMVRGGLIFYLIFSLTVSVGAVIALIVCLNTDPNDDTAWLPPSIMSWIAIGFSLFAGIIWLWMTLAIFAMYRELKKEEETALRITSCLAVLVTAVAMLCGLALMGATIYYGPINFFLTVG